MEDIIPPRELPRIFAFKVLKRGTLYNIQAKKISAKYNEFQDKYKNIPDNLRELLFKIKNDYKLFMNTIYQYDVNDEINTHFISIGELNEQLDYLYENSREGDIIQFSNIIQKIYYIYGTTKMIVVINTIYEPIHGVILPRESFNFLRYNNIHQLKDVNKYYPMYPFKWIEIPQEYYPPQLSDVDKEKLVFLINDKYGIDEEYYKDLPIVPIDIGNKEEYIIYVSISRESKYFNYFKRRPDIKV